MLRGILFVAILAGGTLILQGMELLPRDEAWLVSGVVAAVVLFAIPEGKNRELKDLIVLLLAVIAVYGIYLKFRPWLATLIDWWIATGVSILLLLVLIVGLFFPNVFRRTKSQKPNAT